jgi:hypothetical protein
MTLRAFFTGSGSPGPGLGQVHTPTNEFDARDRRQRTHVRRRVGPSLGPRPLSRSTESFAPIANQIHAYHICIRGGRKEGRKEGRRITKKKSDFLFTVVMLGVRVRPNIL